MPNALQFNALLLWEFESMGEFYPHALLISFTCCRNRKINKISSFPITRYFFQKNCNRFFFLRNLRVIDYFLNCLFNVVEYWEVIIEDCFLAAGKFFALTHGELCPHFEWTFYSNFRMKGFSFSNQIFPFRTGNYFVT